MSSNLKKHAESDVVQNQSDNTLQSNIDPKLVKEISKNYLQSKNFTGRKVSYKIIICK